MTSVTLPTSVAIWLIWRRFSAAIGLIRCQAVQIRVARWRMRCAVSGRLGAVNWLVCVRFKYICICFFSQQREMANGHVVVTAVTEHWQKGVRYKQLFPQPGPTNTQIHKYIIINVWCGWSQGDFKSYFVLGGGQPFANAQCMSLWHRGRLFL